MCAYILVRKARRIKNNLLILLVVGLLAVVDLAYPLSRLFKHTAFVMMAKGMDEKAAFDASACLEGIFVASFNSAVWIFSLKFWVLSMKLKTLFSRANPERLSNFIRILYTGGIFLGISLGVAFAVAGLLYPKGKTASKVFYLLSTLF